MFKLLLFKQIFQRLSIVLAQVKTVNTSENLQEKILQIGKKVKYKEFNTDILQNGTIFMNSKNSKTPDPYRLTLNLSDKINFNRSDKFVAFSNLSI